MGQAGGERTGTELVAERHEDEGFINRRKMRKNFGDGEYGKLDFSIF